MAEVQPVFNKHCVGCHDYGKEAGKKLNLAPDRDADLQHGLHGAVAQGISAVRRRRAGRNPAGLLLGLARQQAGPGAPHARNAGARATATDARGTRPHHHLGRPERRLLSDLRLRVSGQPDRPHPAGHGAAGPAGTADRRGLRPAAELRRQPGAGGQLRPARTQSLLAKFPDSSDPQYREALAIIQAGQGATGPPSAGRHAGLRALRSRPAPRGEVRAPPRRSNSATARRSAGATRSTTRGCKRLGGETKGLRRTEFNFAGVGVSHLVHVLPGKIEFCTSEPGFCRKRSRQT